MPTWLSSAKARRRSSALKRTRWPGIHQLLAATDVPEPRYAVPGLPFRAGSQESTVGRERPRGSARRTLSPALGGVPLLSACTISCTRQKTGPLGGPARGAPHQGRPHGLPASSSQMTRGPECWARRSHRPPPAAVGWRLDLDEPRHAFALV